MQLYFILVVVGFWSWI